MAGVYNPTEVKINMKKITRGNKTYFIGNCDMDISLLDTVIKFYPPNEEEGRYGAVIINNEKRADKEDSEDPE